tara:strand:- start:12078 stop:12443 length:366 start_codon:yes stop_codon:yes gene_type:complete
MELICQDYHFYNNGVFKTISELSPEGWFTDLKKVEPSIRIFGTQEQIDEALNAYIEITGLNLDECYDFKVEPKGSYWYEHRKRRFGEQEAINQNKTVEKKLKEYKEKYNKLSNNKALITTI